MPIKDYTFTRLGGDRPRPMLWVRITNPHIEEVSPLVALAIVDTGADECAFPAAASMLLGHNLESVQPKPVDTAGGTTWAYPHTSRIEILEKRPDGSPGDKVLYTIPDTLVNFTKSLKMFLLGTRNFLGKFVLKINYPTQVFSIRTLQPPHRKKPKKRRSR